MSLDILYDMRSHVERGEPPGNCAHAMLKSCCLSGCKPQLGSEEIRYLEQKLYDGYYAFEAMTERDWNETICGICGVAPVFESGDGNCKNCTPLKKGQVNYMHQVSFNFMYINANAIHACTQFKLQCVWPESSPAHFAGAVDVDGWWKTIEEKIIEAAVYYTAPPIHLVMNLTKLLLGFHLHAEQNRW